MKNLLYLIFATFVFVACSNDDDNSTVIDDLKNETFLDCLVGHKWVYDHPEIPRWEEWNVFDDGVMYLSNSEKYNSDITITNEDVKCNYAYNHQNAGFIITSEKLGTTEGVITNWNKYEFTWKTVAGSFTYGLLLNIYSINSFETFTPDYASLITDASITGFSSHDDKIAEVDGNTGEIKALSGGRTYIDVITTKGTAVVEVNVTGILPYDYCDFLGLERDEIYEKFGKSSYSDTDKQIMYLLSEGEFEYLVFKFDTWTGKVNTVSVTAKENPSFTNDEMKTYLNLEYYAYEKGTTDTQCAYINAETYDEATAGIIWYPKDRQLVIVTINHDLFTDYSPLLGKTKDEVISLMGTPYNTTDAYIVYGLNDKYLNMVGFYYTLDFINYSSTVQAITLSVKEDADKTNIIEFLNKKYIFDANNSTDTNLTFFSSDVTLAIQYDLEYKTIIYSLIPSALEAKAMRMNSEKLLKFE